MLDFLSRFFSKDKRSGSVAKRRLQLVLIQDQSTISPEILMKIKEDIIKVISKYIDIDKEASKIDFQKNSDMIALVASVPVMMSNKRNAESGKGSKRIRKLKKAMP